MNYVKWNKKRHSPKCPEGRQIFSNFLIDADEEDNSVYLDSTDFKPDNDKCQR